jgi:hypothetical protein
MLPALFLFLTPNPQSIRRALAQDPATQGTPLSVDTFSAEVAAAAVEAGATMVNDVSGGAIDPGMLRQVAALGVPFVLMHMRGTPATMQSPENTTYADVVEDVAAELAAAGAWSQPPACGAALVPPGSCTDGTVVGCPAALPGRQAPPPRPDRRRPELVRVPQASVRCARASSPGGWSLTPAWASPRPATITCVSSRACRSCAPLWGARCARCLCWWGPLASAS